MTRIMVKAFVVATVLLSVNYALAHEDFRVIGTLITHQDSNIEVQSRDGKTTSVRLDQQTIITKDSTNVEATVLEVGVSVVVDAYGDSEEDLLALEIRIVPPIANH